MSVHPSAEQLHADHAWERARVAQIARHENAVREAERARVLRNSFAALPFEGVPSGDFKGCVE
jgi:hypothetical protein